MSIKKLIEENNKIVIMSGAGVSTGSGLKDFRSSEGLYSDYSDDPTYILSRSAYNKDSKITLSYILDHFILDESVKPNLGHQFAKDLDDQGKLLGVITQNIDGLYQKTGLSDDKLVEIHGNADVFFCTACQESFDHSKVKENYRSECCDAQVDTDVVLYGDNFDMDRFAIYRQWVQAADLVIVMGTSLNIQAHLMNIAQHENVILINKEDINVFGLDLFKEKYIGDINAILKKEYYKE